MRTVDFGYRRPVLRTRGGRLSVPVRWRGLVVGAVAAALIVVVMVLSLGWGEIEVAPGRVVATLLGRGDHAEQLVVLRWRLPRTLMAVLAGAALAVSGALFQSLTRNPLGSPDVIGFTNGAYAGAVVAIVVMGGKGVSTPVGALLGGLLTAVTVYLLAYRRGVQGFRLIIVGIAVSAVLSSATTWIMMTGDLRLSMSAALWGTGSLNAIGWSHVRDVAVVLAVLTPAVLAAGPALRMLDLGDDTAGALGVRVRGAGLGVAVLGVALIAVIAAYCGLIAFVALAAPQLARRLTGSPGVPVAVSALVGALLLSAADWSAQHGFGDREVPVGVVTVSIGGCYLLFLLVKEARRR